MEIVVPLCRTSIEVTWEDDDNLRPSMKQQRPRTGIMVLALSSRTTTLSNGRASECEAFWDAYFVGME